MAYSSITKPTDYFDTTLITGNGSTQNITGLGFQPDWIWYKRRNATGHHRLIDSVRGSDKLLQTDLTNTEGTDATYVTSFNSDGWSIGSNTDVNASGGTTVAWSWRAGGSASSNSNGSITSSVSANTTSGFSIVTYTGTGSVATVGHGLGVAPKLIIVKTRSLSSQAWPVDSRAASGIAYLNETGGTGSYGDSSPFPSTAPTSTVFSIGTPGNTNGSGETYVAYCFAEVKGFSQFGTYQGVNDTGTAGSIDDVFVYTGFKPAFLLLKKYNSSGTGWFIFDNKRDDDNPISSFLMPQAANSEDSGLIRSFDLLSNGFKSRGNSDDTSGAGSSYLYAAFAEHPFVGNDSGTAVPVTAR